MALDPPTPPAVSGRVNQETIGNAVNALLKWNDSKSKTQKPQLLEEDQFIYLILTLKKIPPKGRTNAFKIPLPHPLHTPPSSELCLIIDDRPKSNLTSDAAKKKIKSEDIPISKVLKLSKLKSDYREFEKKRKLCDSYDMFLADKRIVPLLPRLLGKQFFKKKKIPVPVDLTHKNWKEQIEKVCGSALLYLRTGTCSVLRVGKASMEREEIVENVVAGINGVVELVPKKWANVRSFHLKLSESLALTVYQVLPDMMLKIEGIKGSDARTKRKAGGQKAIKGNVGGKGKKLGKNRNVGWKGGKWGNKKNLQKGRIHEVRYMDGNVDELLGEDGVGIGDNEGDHGSERNENDGMGSPEFGGKKRKKGGLMKEEVLSKVNDEKKLKKLKKVKKGVGVKQKEDGLSLENGEESGGMKEKKKKSKVGKLKNAEVKVKDKKRKKNQAAE